MRNTPAWEGRSSTRAAVPRRAEKMNSREKAIAEATEIWRREDIGVPEALVAIFEKLGLLQFEAPPLTTDRATCLRGADVPSSAAGIEPDRSAVGHPRSREDDFRGPRGEGDGMTTRESRRPRDECPARGLPKGWVLRGLPDEVLEKNKRTK